MLALHPWSEAPAEGVREWLVPELSAGGECAESKELGDALKSTAAALRLEPQADPQQEWELLELGSLGALLGGKPDSAVYWRTQAAEFFRLQGRPTRSVAILEAALQRHPEAMGARAEVLVALAESRRLIGDSSAAWELLEEAEQRLLDGPRWELVGASIPGLRAQIHLDLGLGDLARPWVERALEIARANRDRGPKYEDLLVAAQSRAVTLEAASGNHLEAIRLAEGYLADGELYEGSPAEGAHLLLQRARSVLLLALHGEEDLELAEHELRALLAEAGADLGALDRLDATVLLARTLLASGRVQEARTLHENRPMLPELPLKEASDVAVLGAQLELAAPSSVERLDAASAEVERALDGLMEAWRRAPERTGGVSFLRYAGRRSLLDAWIRLAVARWGEEAGAQRALEKLVQIQRLGTLSRGTEGTSAELSDIRVRLCSDDRGVLVYFVSPERLHVFAFDRHVLVRRERPGRFVFESLQRAWALALDPARMDGPAAAANLEDERDLAARLASFLLPDEIQEVVAGWSELSVVGADLLEGLPLEWLPWRKGAHLGLDVAIAFLPSFPLGLALADQSRSESGERELDLILLAAPEVEPGIVQDGTRLEPLALHAGFVRSLEDLYASKRASLSFGPDASVAALDSPVLARTGILHVIAHTLVDGRRERPIALVLARAEERSGLVWCEDIEHFASPELVLLTCCRSGAAPARRGDANAADMAGAWLAAGARAVLVTQRDLKLSAAERLSAGLHRELVAGSAPAAALRLALKALAREDPAAPLEFVYGLPRLVGWGHTPLYSPRPGPERTSSAAPPGTDWMIAMAVLGGLVVLGVIGARALRARRPAWDPAGRPRNRPGRAAD